MSDRSDEVTTTREPGSTDDLLEETDRLLSEPGSGSEARPTRSTPERSTERPSEVESTAGFASRLRSRLPGVGSRSRAATGRSLSEYVSPKAFLALTAAFGVGLFAGDLVVPLAGGPLGLFSIAFFVGLVASKRRYLETALAGITAGGLVTVAGHLILAFAGSGWAVFVAGAVIGLLASLVGYYLGRDLRDGLFREI